MVSWWLAAGEHAGRNHSFSCFILLKIGNLVKGESGQRNIDSVSYSFSYFIFSLRNIFSTFEIKFLVVPLANIFIR